MITQLLVAAALVAAPATAAPAPTPVPGPCVTRDEAAAFATVFTADALAGTAQACAARLPATAFLRAPAGEAYVAQLRAAADARRPAALTAFTRMSAGHLPAGVTPDLVMAAMSADAMRMGMVQMANDQGCAEANRMIEALAPLPPTNIGTFFSGLTGFGLALTPAIMAMARTAGATVPAATPGRIGPFCAP